MNIFPAILEKNEAEIEIALKRLKNEFNEIHIDVADGALVQSTTLSVEKLLTIFKAHKELRFILHLMVQNPQESVDLLLNQPQITNLSSVLIHSSANPTPTLFKQRLPFKLGLIINPNEEVHAISQKYDLQTIPQIQIMTVNPGLQGQSFLEEPLNKIDQLKQIGYKGEISIDGGVNNLSIELIKRHQILPDTICVGSYLVKTSSEEELKKRVQLLKKATSTLLG